MYAFIIGLLPSLLGLIGQFLAAFLTNFSQTSTQDPNLLAAILGFVQSAEANTTFATGDDKWQWVFDRTMEYLKQEGKDVGKAMINALIELAVQRIRTELVPLVEWEK